MVSLLSKNAKPKLVLFVFLLLSTPVIATCGEPQQTDGISPENQPLSETLADGNVFKRLSKGFSLHKDNYLLLGTWGNRAMKTEDVELKFQFSFKQQIWHGLYFAYTQKSFWRLLDANDSRPFRETNFNPEFFYRRLFPVDSGLGWGYDFGVEHESNGAREPTSRSWNRIYLTPTLMYKGLEAKLKIWYRFEEEVKRNPYDPNGDENPDIGDFYGNGELNLSYVFPNRWQMALMTRHNFATEKGGLQLDFSIPTRIQDLYFFGQLWTGYGESLIDYNHSITRYGLGFSFRQ